jgi:hypothetical protein
MVRVVDLAAASADVVVLHTGLGTDRHAGMPSRRRRRRRGPRARHRLVPGDGPDPGQGRGRRGRGPNVVRGEPRRPRRGRSGRCGARVRTRARGGAPARYIGPTPARSWAAPAATRPFGAGRRETERPPAG